MKGIAIFFGALILIFLGIPTLLGAVWATGISTGALTGDFFTQISEEIVPEIEQLADESLEIAQQPDATSDPNARAWIDAMSRVDTTPSDLLRQTGISAWLENDLAATLRQLDQVLRGELELGAVVLNLQPLRDALSSQPMRDYVNAVVGHLPPCTEQHQASWARIALSESSDEPIPACNPGPEVTAHVLNTASARIPVQSELFETAEAPPLPFRSARFATAAVWALFFAPLFFITIGALLAGRGAKGFFGWSGGTILAGGLLALASSWLAGKMSFSMMRWRAENWRGAHDMWLFDTEEGRKIAAHVGETFQGIAEPLFSPVFTIAAVVAGIGLLFLVFSLIAKPAS